MNPLAEFFASNVDFSNALRSTEDGIVSRVEARSGQTTPQEPGQRVCDRCIVKKVKCDMRHPTCSRCLEADAHCIYSVKKRKPGPVKGSKHARRKTSTKDSTASSRSSISESSSPSSSRSTDASSSQTASWSSHQGLPQDTLSMGQPMMTIPEAQSTQMYSMSASSPTVPHSIPSPLGIPPNSDQQRILLERFFVHIHPSIPLFHRERLLARYEAGSLCQHLLLTICVVTAKILELSSSWNGSSLDDCIAYLLDLKVVDNESAGKALSLDNFRQACLLAFYAFHQYPGERAWMRIGNLTRKAYQCGLHQIDYNSAGSAFDHEKVGAEDLEEWRYVWWCIYCLDCYSNVTAVTPFIVEFETVKTALVSSSLIGSRSDLQRAVPVKYLPDDTDMLWKTAKEVTSMAGEINFNMHILTTTLIREAATIHRLRKQSTSKKLAIRMADLEDHFSAFRLALPARYLTASRNVFVNESSSEHHARLICVLHIHLARTLTYFPSDPRDNLGDWLTKWQQCLECGQDIVDIVKQWDGQYFTATDPAICFIIAFTLTLLHLHSCAEDVTLEFKVRMETYKDVLILFLEQFATAWSLPRFLIISFNQFKKIVTGSLSPIDIDRILKVCLGPINYRWLNFLSLSADFENLDSPGRMYENLFSQEWDSNEWETLVPMATA